MPCMPKLARKNKSSPLHILAPHSAGCIYERTEEEKAGRGQCPGWVVNPGWVWIPPVSTYMRVLCHLWNYHRDTLRMEGCFACLLHSLLKAGVLGIDSVSSTFIDTGCAFKVSYYRLGDFPYALPGNCGP